MIEKYLNNRLITLYLLPFIIGIFSVFSFQPFNYTLVNFFILPILFYLIVFVKKKSQSFYRKKPFKTNLFVLGTLFGFGFYISGIHWITHSLTFDDNFKILIPFGLILVPLFLSLFFSITIILVGPYLNLNLQSVFLFSASFAFADFLRAKILSGFPWNLWAYSFSWATELIQVLNIIGLFAFNLLVITLFTLPVLFIFKISLGKKFLTILLISIFGLASFIYGNHTLNKNEEYLETVNDKFNIKIVSPNFELKYNLDYNEMESRLKKLIKYSEPNKNFKTLFIWPEGVFSGYSLDELEKFENTFSRNFSENHYILFGVNQLNKKGDGFYNTLIVVNNNFEKVQEYKKQKLVPFGEFLPFESVLNKIGLKKITEGHGSFLKGINKGFIQIDTLNILPLICYEIIFTKLIQLSDDRTNLIINISEDGWFGDSIGPHQHFSKGVFRAIEHNSFLLRSANKGISAIISNKGEVLKKLNPNEAGNIELEIPLIKK